MTNAIVIVSTVMAGLFALGGFVTLSRKLYVVSGTLFLFTAFSIYIRETYK